MPTPRLAVILPTIGRETFWRTRLSIDGGGSKDALLLPMRDETPHGDHGAWLRMRGMLTSDELGATHVTFIDDDDAIYPGSLALREQWITDEPDAIHVGRMLARDGTVLAWRDVAPRFAFGNVGTPMLTVPLRYTDGVEWPGGIEGDWLWIRTVVAKAGRNVLRWHTEPLAVVRPWG